MLVPEICFWPIKTKKNLNFLRCIHVFDLVLKFCSDRNEGIWLQFPFYFLVLIDKVASVIDMSVFICFLGFRLKFFRIALLRKRLQLDSKTDLTTNVLICVFCWYMPRFADFMSPWTKFCKNCSHVVLS